MVLGPTVHALFTIHLAPSTAIYDLCNEIIENHDLDLADAAQALVIGHKGSCAVRDGGRDVKRIRCPKTMSGAKLGSDARGPCIDLDHIEMWYRADQDLVCVGDFRTT